MASMQDYSADGYDGYDGAPPRLARLRRTASTTIGAAIALTLMVGVGTWFYRLGVRDAGNVPIIRAAAEPAKTRPEDPGGLVTPHQDITSYRVAESKPAQATAAVIAPPPAAPAREDVAMGKLAPERAEPPPPPAAKAPEPPARTMLDKPTETVATGAEPAVPAAAPEKPAPAVAASAAPPAETPEPAPRVPAQPPATERAPAADPFPHSSDLAPPLSPVAPARPADLRARMAAAAQSAERSADELALRAAQSAIQVQLAADPDEATIRAMWQRISGANADILHDRALSVQTTISGGTKFYRLRVGPFSGISEARAVCQALKARGQDCIVARNG